MNDWPADPQLYDPRTGKFSPTGSMIAARSVSATTLLDGRVLVAGSYHGGYPLLSAELYEP